MMGTEVRASWRQAECWGRERYEVLIKLWEHSYGSILLCLGLINGQIKAFAWIIFILQRILKIFISRDLKLPRICVDYYLEWAPRESHLLLFHCWTVGRQREIHILEAHQLFTS